MDEVVLRASVVPEHLEKRSRKEKNQENTIMDLLLDILPEDGVICGHVRDVIVKATILVCAGLILWVPNTFFNLDISYETQQR